MPAKLLHLQQQLDRIQAVYDAALQIKTASYETLAKLRQQILDLESRIIQRRRILAI